MPITKTLRDNIKYFGIALPVDRRTNAYKEELKKRNLNEKSYLELLKTSVKQAKAKEQKKIKQIEKQTKAQLERLEIQREQKRKQIPVGKLIKPLQINFIRNKLFRQNPVESAFKSYWQYSIINDRPSLIYPIEDGITVNEILDFLT